MLQPKKRFPKRIQRRKQNDIIGNIVVVCFSTFKASAFRKQKRLDADGVDMGER